MGPCSGRERGNCIAVVFGGHLTEENLPPVAAFFGGDGELECGFAGGVAEDGGAGKQPPAQGRQFGALGLAEPALPADTKIVGADREVAGRLGGPERAATQALQPELRAQFLDAILDVGPALVAPPYLPGADRGWQVGAQGLEPLRV